MNKIRFHFDEHVDPDIAIALRRRGIDVTTTVEAGLLGQSDDAHIAFARDEQRVMVTHDVDFLRYASSESDHYGSAYCHKTAYPIGHIIDSLILIYEEEMAGRVEYL